MTALCFIGTFIFFRRCKKAEIFSHKSLFRGISLLMLFLGLTRVCYLIGVLLPVDYDFWTILGYVFSLIAMSALLFEFERSIVKKTKYSLTIFSLFGTTVAILSLSEYINRDIN